jgi:putative flippase GtrA
MNKTLRRISDWKITRFALVGICAAVTDLLLFWLLNQRLGWPRMGAQAVSRPAGGLMSFSLNKIWTFDNREMRAAPRQFMRYALLWAGGFLVSSLLIELYRAVLPSAGRYDFIAKMLAETTLGLLSFLTQRYWVFRAEPDPAGK